MRRSVCRLWELYRRVRSAKPLGATQTAVSRAQFKAKRLGAPPPASGVTPGAGRVRARARRRCERARTHHPPEGGRRARARRPPARVRGSCDPRPGVGYGQSPKPAMCVRNVDVHVSCSSHVDAHFAAFFIDPRAK
jgi:hypothetical protein